MKKESKYLNRSYGGWRVIGREKTPQYDSCQGSHSTFILLKTDKNNVYHIMSLSDREIRLIDQGKPIKKTIKNKSMLVKRGFRVQQNSIDSI